MINLTNNIVVSNLSRVKVQAVHYEANEERGQEWVEVFCEYGFMDDGTFVSYPHPATKESLLFFKFENGMHPERPGLALGRCDTCNDWHFAISGPCEDPGCGGTVAAFPSYNRFRNKIDASLERDIFHAAEAFLTHKDGTEGVRFPNPDDRFDIRVLVDGTT